MPPPPLSVRVVLGRSGLICRELPDENVLRPRELGQIALGLDAVLLDCNQRARLYRDALRTTRRIRIAEPLGTIAHLSLDMRHGSHARQRQLHEPVS